MAKKRPVKKPAPKRASITTAAKLPARPELTPEEEEERKKRLQLKILHITTYRDRAKKAYAKAGTLLNELIREMAIGEQVELPDGRIVTLEDAFANVNYVYRQTSFTRVDIRVSG